MATPGVCCTPWYSFRLSASQAKSKISSLDVECNCVLVELLTWKWQNWTNMLKVKSQRLSVCLKLLNSSVHFYCSSSIQLHFDHCNNLLLVSKLVNKAFFLNPVCFHSFSEKWRKSTVVPTALRRHQLAVPMPPVWHEINEN